MSSPHRTIFGTAERCTPRCHTACRQVTYVSSSWSDVPCNVPAHEPQLTLGRSDTDWHGLGRVSPWKTVVRCWNSPLRWRAVCSEGPARVPAGRQTVCMPADGYERRVEAAVAAPAAVSHKVWSDLDRALGGVGWWDVQLARRCRGYAGRRPGGEGAPRGTERRERLAAEGVGGGRCVGGCGNDAYIAAMKRDGVARRRERQIDSSVTHAVGHMLRPPDCLSAALVIVGAVPQQVRRADWSHVAWLAEQCRDDVKTPKLEPAGSPGRAGSGGPVRGGAAGGRVRSDGLAGVARWESQQPHPPWRAGDMADAARDGGTTGISPTFRTIETDVRPGTQEVCVELECG